MGARDNDEYAVTVPTPVFQDVYNGVLVDAFVQDGIPVKEAPGKPELLSRPVKVGMLMVTMLVLFKNIPADVESSPEEGAVPNPVPTKDDIVEF